MRHCRRPKMARRTIRLAMQTIASSMSPKVRDIVVDRKRKQNPLIETCEWGYDLSVNNSGMYLDISNFSPGGKATV